MNELSLFSGVGGGLQGTLLLGWTPIGYVESNKYCQRIIRQRIIDNILPNAPIFGNIETFIDSGCAELYRGITDVITAGWPCQPHSVAGRRKGANDERDMWPETAECIRIIKPKWFLGENVPGILSTDSGRYFGNVLTDLAEMDYDAVWGVFSACAAGAPHTRERLFILAYARCFRPQNWEKQYEGSITGNKQGEARQWTYSAKSSDLPISNTLWEAMPSDILRMVDGDANWSNRIKAIGNGQIPTVVATAWNVLSQQFDIA